MAKVYVLLFNARTETEGIHTVQMGERHKILMFESEDDATRYCLLLEAQDFPAATVEAIDSDEIEAFCQQADYDWELVKEGMLAIPPEHNVEETDWRTQKEFRVEELEPEPASEMPQDELERIRRQLEGLI